MTLSGWRQPVTVVVAIACLLLVVRVWEHLTGLSAWSHQYNVLARKWLVAQLVALAVAIAVVLVFDEPVATAATAVVVFVAVVVLGRRADKTVQHRLRHGSRTR